MRAREFRRSTAFPRCARCVRTGGFFLAVVACTLLTCHAPAPGPEGIAEAEAPRAKPSAGRFDSAAAAPSDAVAEVRRALDAGDPAKAARGADRALADPTRPTGHGSRGRAPRPPLMRDWEGAATRLAALADSSHPLVRGPRCASPSCSSRPTPRPPRAAPSPWSRSTGPGQARAAGARPVARRRGPP